MIILHKYRPYKKAKTFTTYWIVSVFNNDIFKMFDRAAKKIDDLLWYKRQVNERKI